MSAEAQVMTERQRLVTLTAIQMAIRYKLTRVNLDRALRRVGQAPISVPELEALEQRIRDTLTLVCDEPGLAVQLRGHLRGRGILVNPAAVRAARMAAGLSMSALAEPQFTRGMISLVEHGKSNPSIHLLRQIAERTNHPVSYFLASLPQESTP